MSTTTVTPLLDIGGGNDSVDEAVERILSRERANVASVADAREVLGRLGLDELQVDDRIHFALTGTVLAGR